MSAAADTPATARVGRLDHPLPQAMAADIWAAVDACYGSAKPTAVKRGRNPRYPYVPVIDYSPSLTGSDRTDQVAGLAYTERADAVAAAARHLDALRNKLAADLAKPNKRALREWHGLPRELRDDAR